MLIINGSVYTEKFRFEKKNIRVDDGKIISVMQDVPTAQPGEEVIDAAGMKVIPGLADIHFHGCAGYDFCDASEEAITRMAQYEKSVGVTNICPATMTLSGQRLTEICKAAAAHISGEDEADLIGINLEGPFISPDRVGAQNPEYVKRPDAEMLQRLIDASGQLVRLVTIAPEVPGAMECIHSMSQKVHFSVGHTMADCEEAAAAFAEGADHVTHLYNAMPGLSHRNPGVVGAAADGHRVMAELICDGIHIHPVAVRAAFTLFGPERMILISDSTRACGMPDGAYELGGIPVYKKDGAVRQTDGTLAGSAVNVYDCLRNVIRMGIPEEVAVRAATYNPLSSIGMLRDRGTIEPGKKAQLLLVDTSYELKKIIA